MGSASGVDLSGRGGQYVDLETCRDITGEDFDENLFNIFAIKVVPRYILEQLVQRPTVSDLKACKVELEELIRSKYCGPIMVRAAWHDSGTYDDYIGIDNWPKCGGANGSIRLELDLPENAGLAVVFEMLAPIKEKHPSISWADILQMASVVAIEVAGGPVINLRYGRIDVYNRLMCHPSGPLPLGSGPWQTTPVDHLREVFYRMGFTDKEIVLLSGAHTLGRTRLERSGLGKSSTPYTTAGACPLGGGRQGLGKEGGTSWTINWLQFDNSYYQNLLKPPDEDLIQLDTDKALVQDPDFRRYVEFYATDSNAFFADYAEAHRRLSELGAQFIPPEGIQLSER